MTIILDESPGLLGVTGDAWSLSLESRNLIKMLDFFGMVFFVWPGYSVR